MTRPRRDTADPAAGAALARKLKEAGLDLAAEAFGYEPEAAERRAVNAATCPEGEFEERVRRIAEITGDRLLAERVEQRLEHPGLKRALSPAMRLALDIYADRFYSFWDEGQQVFIRSELSDLAEWYPWGVDRSEAVFTEAEMEAILGMSCARDQMKKSPLLRKLIDHIRDSEIVRVGYFYPIRDMAREVLSDLFTKLRELLLIRERHESAMQLGEHPEELIPYIWANIVKSLMNVEVGEALGHINMLAYLHYASQQTESKITGSDAYAKLKKEFVLFNRETQRNWPGEIRKLFLDPAITELLNRYRFVHGLPAFNRLLAFQRADRGGGRILEDRDEDAIVAGGLIRTRTGFVKSSGFDDKPLKQQYLLDEAYFQEMLSREKAFLGENYFGWHRDIKDRLRRIDAHLPRIAGDLDDLMAGLAENIRLNEETVRAVESMEERKNPSGLRKLWTRKGGDGTGLDLDVLKAQIETDRAHLERLAEVKRMQDEIQKVMGDTWRFF